MPDTSAHHVSRLMRPSKFGMLLAFVVLAGCASGPATTTSSPDTSTTASTTAPTPTTVTPPIAAPAPAPAASTPAELRTAAASTLAVERQWLAAWFKGTPVVIAQRANGALVVEVPRDFCFDPGQDTIKDALAAVLDKVSQSMRRTAIAELHLIAAPADASGSAATLASRRATRVYNYLKARGVPEARLTKPTATGGTAVQLRIEAASPA